MIELTPADLLPFLPRACNSQQRSLIACHHKRHKSDVIWCRAIELLCSNKSPYEKLLIVSDCITSADIPDDVSCSRKPPRLLSAKKVRRLLGEEVDCVLFDARDDFDLDALGVVSGLIRGGGCLLLLLPDVSAWQKKTTAFYSHLRSMLLQQPGVFYLQNAADLNQQTRFPVDVVETQEQYLPCKTQDQYRLLSELFSEITQQVRLCHVLVSGRGRGKSSLLGLLAAKLLQQTAIRIIIMAPARSTADPFFYHLLEQCDGAETEASVVRYAESEVVYMAPDAVLESLSRNELSSTDLLLVDEAAAIPQSMLSVLLRHFDKLIFSSTTHGYEGSGRGFVLKFFKLLDQLRPDWKKNELHQPVRWQQHDWLEQWVEKLLFLNLKTDQALVENFSRDELYVEQIDPLELVREPKKLQSVFSLLVSAHYRTRPSDFAYLLDSEDVHLYVLRINSVILAVLAVNQEGDFDAELSTQIYRGTRRPRGHLLAQTLCFHGGVETAAQLNYARIMRIAVHPAMQRKGLGCYLLDSVIKSESQRGLDVIGCSFSAESGLLEFWRAANFSLLRIGFSRDHVSASYALVMGLSLSDKGQVLFNQLQTRLSRNLPVWLSEFLTDMSDTLKKALRELVAENVGSQQTENFSVSDLDDVISFAHYQRNYAACWPAISRLINRYKMHVDGLPDNEKIMLYACVKYANDWPAIVKTTALSGRTEAEKSLRRALQNLLATYLRKNNVSGL